MSLYFDVSRINWKNKLQEQLQSVYGFPCPTYTTVRNETSPAHEPAWTSTVTYTNPFTCNVEKKTIENVTGSKKNAEQRVAYKALEALEVLEILQQQQNNNDNNVCTQNNNNNSNNTLQLSFHPKTNHIENYACYVYVDADHISFLTENFCQKYPRVHFSMYGGFGSHLPHVQSALQSKTKNCCAYEAPKPGKDLADTMIMVHLTWRLMNNNNNNNNNDVDTPVKPLIVVSRDKALYNLEVLFPRRVRFCSTEIQLKSLLT